jgi:hypothetical protein
VNLAVSIRDDDQVNPLRVVDVSQGVTRLYRIETGERRYWLLRDFLEGYEGDGMVGCPRGEYLSCTGSDSEDAKLALPR